MSLGLMLEAAAGRYGEKIALVSGERRLSYADLDKASNRVANALLKIGLNKGDRVAMLLPNSLEFVITYFGIIRAGAIAVPLDTNCKVAEYTSLIGDFLPKVLIGESLTLEPLAPVLSWFKSIEHVVDIDSRSNGQFLSYGEIMADSPAQRVEIEPEPDDIALITYTSGPSFSPRGAALTHQSLMTSAVVSADGFGQTGRDVMMLFALPLYHQFGLVAAMLASVYEGSTLVMVPGTGLSLGSFLAAIEREKGTMYLGIPYIYALLIDMAEKEGISNDLSSMRLWCSAGAPLPLDVARRFRRHYNYVLLDAWGLSETVCHITCAPVSGTRKPGSVGKVLHGWEVKVVDDNGRCLPPNRTGELVIRGPMMTRYYGNPEATAEIMRGGWLYSGDIGRVDEDGYVFITGRKKEMLIIKGQNVYPGDIEVVLSAHPKVAEVAALGIPDRLRGEVVGAVVSLKKGEVATEQELRRFCLERIASFKVPKQVMFLDSLPRTAAGKIDKESIRDRLSIPPIFSEEAISTVEG